MKKSLTLLVVVAMVVGLTAFAWGQAAEEGQQQERVQRGERGPAAGERGGAQAQRGGIGVLPPGAYLTVTGASEELWTKLGEMQAQMHAKTWELSLLHSQGADAAQIQAKIAEMRELMQAFVAARQELREYMVLPEGMRGQPREGGPREGGARQGGPREGGAQQGDGQN